MEKINKKEKCIDILLQELQENTYIERVEDVIFWALEAYAKKEEPSNGSIVAYAIVNRIKDAEGVK